MKNFKFFYLRILPVFLILGALESESLSAWRIRPTLEDIREQHRSLISKRVIFKIKQVDLSHFPASITRYSPNQTLTFGDMHGSALKLLYLLIANGVIEMSPEQYEQFRNNYSAIEEAPDPTLQRSIENSYRSDAFWELSPLLKFFSTFSSCGSPSNSHCSQTSTATPTCNPTLPALPDIPNSCIAQKINAQMIDSVRLNLPAPSLRFLGDLLADRGRSDWLTLKILAKLDHAVRFTILDSNHDHEFVAWWQHRDLNSLSIPLEIARSLRSLQRTVDNKTLCESALDALVFQYSRHIKIAELIRDRNNNPVLFTHAPVGTQELSNLLRHYGIAPPKWSRFSELHTSIEDLNRKFKLDDFPFPVHRGSQRQFQNSLKIAQRHPRNRFVWVRTHEVQYPFPSNIIRVHGHDGGSPSFLALNEITLDDGVGKQAKEQSLSSPTHLGILVTEENCVAGEDCAEVAKNTDSSGILDTLN